ncbi:MULTISPECIES: hypothetical protein [unclassified Variovorax]|uniref:hypothetical protein n=1 Tax=unclassified Variovorax TaxID=663243 RepID=UPI003ECD7B17
MAAVGLALALSAAAVLALPRAEPPRHAPVAKTHLDGLRVGAANGDADASRRLTSALLDQYRDRRNPEALMEAMQWLDRDWDTSEYFASRLTTSRVRRWAVRAPRRALASVLPCGGMNERPTECSNSAPKK